MTQNDHFYRGYAYQILQGVVLVWSTFACGFICGEEGMELAVVNSCCPVQVSVKGSEFVLLLESAMWGCIGSMYGPETNTGHTHSIPVGSGHLYLISIPI